jgi:hypothetical protein
MTIEDLVALLKALDKWLIFFGILVALGVVGEAIVGFVHFRKSNELQRLQTAENLRQQKEIERLKEHGQELEAVIQPRYLDASQRLEVESAMRSFSGRNVLIASQWIDLEAARLAKEIKLSLNRAGVGTGNTFATMTVDKIGAYPEVIFGLFGGGGGTIGPQLRTGIQIWGTDRPAVMALASALGKLRNVTTPPQSENPYANGLPPEYASMSLTVFVGSKPIPEAR